MISPPPQTEIPTPIRQVLRSALKMTHRVNSKVLKHLSPDLREDFLGFPHSCLQFLGPSSGLQNFHSMSQTCHGHFLGSWRQPLLTPNSPPLGPQNKPSAMIIASEGLFAPWLVPCPHSPYTHCSIISLPCIYSGSKPLFNGLQNKTMSSFPINL